MNRRKAVLALLSIGAVPLPAKAQTGRPIQRIGYLAPATAQANAAYLTALRAGMRELGWVEGRDYEIDARFANGVSQAVPSLATELVAARPDLLLVLGDGPSRHLAQKTKTIPIVLTISADPIGNKLAASLRRPGGNVTGLASLSTELSAKRLQLLKEAFPRVVHAALLFAPDDIGSMSQVKQVEEAAPRLGMRVTRVELGQPADIEPAFKRSIALGAQAYIVTQGGGTTTSYRRAIIDRIVLLKVPAMFPVAQYVEAGGLMSYSASYTENSRRAAAYVDKILKGAKPGDLPIELPTKFELVLNLKTARTMGLTLPESFMLAVDRVIE